MLPMKIKKKDLVLLVMLFLVVLLVFTPSLLINIFQHSMNDYDLHLSFAHSLQAGEEIPAFTFAHPFFQFAVIAIGEIFSISLENAAVILQLGGYLFLAAVLYFYLREYLHKINLFLKMALVMVLMIATPVFMLVLRDQLHYLGYLGITTYHNPTINLLKPFALVIMIYSLGLLQGRKTGWLDAAIVFISIVVSTLIKPSFIICLIPALGILGVLKMCRREPLDWRMLIIGMAIPSALILLGQYYITYVADEPGVIFAPFAVMRFYSDLLLVKFILSIWFPLMLTLSYFKEMKKDKNMQLTWLVFLFGVLYTYMIAEDGGRFQHGNFGWSGEIAMFLLFVNSVHFLLKQGSKDDAEPKKTRLVWLLGFMPHIIFGVIYYVFCLMNNTFV